MGSGAMVVKRFPPQGNITLVGGANAKFELGYGSMLHRLMYDGVNPDYSGVKKGKSSLTRTLSLACLKDLLVTLKAMRNSLSVSETLHSLTLLPYILQAAPTILRLAVS
jgi:hypothetical protein